MVRSFILKASLPAIFVLSLSSGAFAQAAAPMLPNAYGPPISSDNAKKAAAAALAEARKNNWTMAIAVVDSGGALVYYERMDGTQLGSINVAINKAHSSVLYKRPTKIFHEQLAAGGDGMRIFGLEGAVPVEGGVPIIVGGQIIGAIGVSGGATAQDGQTANAGANAVK